MISHSLKVETRIHLRNTLVNGIILVLFFSSCKCMVLERGAQRGEPSDFGTFREMIKKGVSRCFRVEGRLQVLFPSKRNPHY